MLISVSYSLFGQNSIYYIPLRVQIEVFNKWKSEGRYKEFNFEMVVFVDKSVDLNFFKDLPLKLIYIEDFVELRNVPPKMWRYYNVFYNEADVYLFRDSDSSITVRELDFIRIWLKTDYDSNVIRDTRLHLFPIMAGTFSVRKGCISIFKDILKSSNVISLSNEHFYDQIFLSEAVYPKLKSELLVFTNFLCFKQENYIRTEYINKNFIGGYYNDNNLATHWHDGEFVTLSSQKILKLLFYSTTLILFFISIIIIINKTKNFLNGNK